MDITAIICEYHLFHHGHARQIAWVREKFPGTTVLALMSGSFVQRGEAAMYDADARARVAVACGADLVLELPFPWSMSAGPTFAAGAIGILAALGVTRFCFGCECGDLSALQTVAENLTSPAYTAALAAAVETDAHGTASAIELGAEVYRQLFGAGYPETPNDILGVSYLAAGMRIPNAPCAVTLRREGTESATVARAALRAGDRTTLAALLPAPSLALTENPFVKNEDIAPAMLTWYRLADPRALDGCADFDTGDAFRICRAAETATDYAGLCAGVRQKRLTDARVRRMLWYGMLGITRAHLSEAPAYTVLLAANRQGCAALRAFARTSDFPILSKRADYKAHGETVTTQFARALRAEALHALLAGEAADAYLVRRPYVKNGADT